MDHGLCNVLHRHVPAAQPFLYDRPMLPKLHSVITPKRFLLAGIVSAVALLSVNTVGEYQKIAAARQQFQRAMRVYNGCVAELQRSAKYGDLLDVAVDGMCPVKPSRALLDSLVNEKQRSRRAGARLAVIMIALASLPWLASRLVRSKVRPPIQA